MKKKIAIVCVLVLGCEKAPPNELHCFWLPPVAGGGAGAGASAGASAGGSSAVACDPDLSFAGSDFCFDPSDNCCALMGADLGKYCYVQTDGLRPVPVSCTTLPPISSPATDGRACTQVDSADLGCEWGDALLLCCEP